MNNGMNGSDSSSLFNTTKLSDADTATFAALAVELARDRKLVTEIDGSRYQVKTALKQTGSQFSFRSWVVKNRDPKRVSDGLGDTTTVMLPQKSGKSVSKQGADLSLIARSGAWLHLKRCKQLRARLEQKRAAAESRPVFIESSLLDSRLPEDVLTNRIMELPESESIQRRRPKPGGALKKAGVVTGVGIAVIFAASFLPAQQSYAPLANTNAKNHSNGGQPMKLETSNETVAPVKAAIELPQAKKTGSANAQPQNTTPIQAKSANYGEPFVNEDVLKVEMENEIAVAAESFFKTHESQLAGESVSASGILVQQRKDTAIELAGLFSSGEVGDKMHRLLFDEKPDAEATGKTPRRANVTMYDSELETLETSDGVENGMLEILSK